LLTAELALIIPGRLINIARYEFMKEEFDAVDSERRLLWPPEARPFLSLTHEMQARRSNSTQLLTSGRVGIKVAIGMSGPDKSQKQIRKRLSRGEVHMDL
jgi:hypothetical protein